MNSNYSLIQAHDAKMKNQTAKKNNNKKNQKKKSKTHPKTPKQQNKH